MSSTYKSNPLIWWWLLTPVNRHSNCNLGYARPSSRDSLTLYLSWLSTEPCVYGFIPMLLQLPRLS